MSSKSGLPVLVGSWNSGPAMVRAVERASAGLGLLDAIVEGISLVEDDPEEMSVGFGGLPNEEGVVELDAAVMDGPRHKAGAVAGLRGVRHAARVAVEVLRRTDHALLVGDGALRFARQLGFQEENLLTEQSRAAWLAWKAGLSSRDAWLSPDEGPSEFGQSRWAGHRDNPTPGGPPASPRPGDSGGSPAAPFTFGTIHVSGMDARGDLFACTSTSGLSYKIPGRAGDSPIVGAGLYVENRIGSAGCTGRGEAALQNAAAYHTVLSMERGLSPTEAALETLRRIARNTCERRLLASEGRPSFNVTVYALRKDGAAGAAAMHPGYTYVSCRDGEQRVENCAVLFGD
ncbi:N4-(beta-N-acetylglucosaminyl)-L-asparaginase [Phycisphaerales bacterium]|nr:N4-(beta-N-acetylglucosaminyl)-L-asparaginase [Phycisphaerales bacterium]